MRSMEDEPTERGTFRDIGISYVGFPDRRWRGLQFEFGILGRLRRTVSYDGELSETTTRSHLVSEANRL